MKLEEQITKSNEFMKEISKESMKTLVENSQNHTLVDRGSYFWGMNNDVYSPSAGPCIIVGLGFPVGKIFHNSSWDYLETYLDELREIKTSKVVVTGTSIWRPDKKSSVNNMNIARTFAENIIYKKFGKEMVEIKWSDDKTWTDLFYEKITNTFYRSTEKVNF